MLFCVRKISEKKNCFYIICINIAEYCLISLRTSVRMNIYALYSYLLQLLHKGTYYLSIFLLNFTKYFLILKHNPIQLQKIILDCLFNSLILNDKRRQNLWIVIDHSPCTCFKQPNFTEASLYTCRYVKILRQFKLTIH